MSWALEVTRLLIEAGAEVNAMDAEGITPVLLAAHAMQWDVVQRLVKAGANVNVKVRHSFGASLALVWRR